MKQENYFIKADKLVFNIPFDKCKIAHKIEYSKSLLGLNYDIKQDGILIKLSGKLFAKPDDFGSINKLNMNLLSEKIYQLTDINIDNHYLLNDAPVFSVDIKEDFFLEENPQYYLSECREIFRKKSDKFEITRYLDLKYQDGLALIPKTKEKLRFSMYNKGKDIQRSYNKEYRKIFDYKFLEKSINSLRMELQLASFKRMRKEFGISSYFDPTINYILSCERNVVADFYEELMNQ